MVRGLVLAAVCLLSACFSADITTCPTVECPGEMVCDGHGGCAVPEQLAQCSGRDDGTPCAYTSLAKSRIDGSCAGQLCLPLACGNGVISPDEQCDDGNNQSGDGCSADCQSLETCGNGAIDPAAGEQCDDQNTADGDGCQHDCKLPACGDGVKDTSLDEECDGGAANSNAPDAACRLNCRLPRCGDHVADPGAAEICDDGNNASADGCSGDCKSDETCGNDIVDALAGEVCDDGGTMDGDGCSANCRSVEVCGNHVIDLMFGEVCDDGNTVSGDGCSSDCRSLEMCGNGIIDTLNEQCDLGDLNADTADSLCRTSCKLPACGDGIADPQHGEQCDDGLLNADAADACRTSCQNPRCGDDIQDVMEVCDDGNTDAGDNCSSDCRSLEVCGNGIIDTVDGEQCDNGVSNSNSANATCRVDCNSQRCGDSIVDTTFGESCDLGAANSNVKNADCRANCVPQRCGDGVKDDLKGEVCDDGNVVSGDNCSSDCKSIETCGNGIIDLAKGEQCDAGTGVNANAPDAPCRLDCKLPTCGDSITDPGLGEVCDAGAANSNSANAACRTNCLPRRCGDTVVDGASGEKCDDGNTASNDGCAPDCRSDETCGNGVVDIATGEQCDAGGLNANTPNAPCRVGCTLPSCGDSVIDTALGEVCDGGAANANTADAACRTNCQPRRCGDAVKDVGHGEVCDDGNVASGDMCSADCKSDESCGNGVIDIATSEQCDNGVLNSNAESSTCRPDCTRQRCGDMIVDTAFAETCDLGAANSNSADATCRVNCTPRRCGDGIKDVIAGEVCDDGNTASNDGCSADCRSNETCRNGIIDVAKGEQCDDNNAINTDQCHNDCTLPRCGDAVVDFNEQCDLGASNNDLPNTACHTNCVPRRCGDTIVDTTFEVCDDGNIFSGDGCSGDCRSNETCGNGVVDGFKGELCDDGNKRGKDGCSGCEPEDAVALTPGGAPPARESEVLVYDAARKRVVMFGGWTPSGNQGDTWEWDGVSWTQMRPVHSPAPRLAAAAAYDPKRKRIVMFGGYRLNYGDPAQDTWEYDGVDWTPITPVGTLPANRAGAAMTYDANLGLVLMFGGAGSASVGTPYFQDTWTWNGTAWALLDPATKPAVRAGARMVFDSTNKYVVMYGGEPLSGQADDNTWTWNGSNWTDRGNANGPGTGYYANGMAFDAQVGRVTQWSGATSATYEWNGATLSWTAISQTTATGRTHVTMAYDAARKQIVMFGGGGAITTFPRPNTVLSDTWLRTGSAAWTQPAAFAEPPARYRSATAYDPIRKKVVLFGGQSNATTMLNDTWEWDGRSWAQVSVASPPPIRAGHGLDFDTKDTTQSIRLYGGDNTTSTFTDVYRFTGTAWTAVASAGRTSTKGATLSYDVQNDRLVTFGGLVTASSTVTNQTWVWTAAGGWSSPSPATKPPARDDAATAYDPVRQRTVLFGGDPNNGQQFSDVWELSGTGASTLWTSVPATGGPGLRNGHRMFYNPDARAVTVLGNAGLVEDMWEWTGALWREADLTTSITSRNFTTAAYHAQSRAVVAFSGLDASTNAATARTLLIQYRSNSAIEACTDSQVDYDNDGLSGCSDDECWSVCDPMHPPGTSRPVGAPFCGDTVCNSSLEDCAICPGDCGTCAGAKCGDFHCDAPTETTVTCPNDCYP
jgi:cysteine-rich repeat protein